MCTFASPTPRGMATIPESFPITAYKVVNVTKTGSWRSTSYRPDGVTYRTGRTMRASLAPTISNTAGFWVFRDKAQARKQGKSRYHKRRVITVKVWGNIVVTGDGYRAESCRTVTKKKK